MEVSWFYRKKLGIFMSQHVENTMSHEQATFFSGVFVPVWKLAECRVKKVWKSGQDF